jgi:hypothetical protein
MLKIKIRPCLEPAVDSLPHKLSIVGMNSLKYQLQLILQRVHPEDAALVQQTNRTRDAG